MTQHVETRRRLCCLDTASLNAVLNLIPLSDTDRTIMTLYYLKRHDFNYIADHLGFSESTIRRRHRNIIKRLYGKF